MSRYIDETPYLTFAEAEMADDNSPEVFLRSHFPEATDHQVQSFILYSISKFHAGVVSGLEISGVDPIGEVEAYQLGVKEGLARNQNS